MISSAEKCVTVGNAFSQSPRLSEGLCIRFWKLFRGEEGFNTGLYEKYKDCPALYAGAKLATNKDDDLQLLYDMSRGLGDTEKQAALQFACERFDFKAVVNLLCCEPGIERGFRENFVKGVALEKIQKNTVISDRTLFVIASLGMALTILPLLSVTTAMAAGHIGGGAAIFVIAASLVVGAVLGAVALGGLAQRHVLTQKVNQEVSQAIGEIERSGVMPSAPPSYAEATTVSLFYPGVSSQIECGVGGSVK